MRKIAVAVAMIIATPASPFEASMQYKEHLTLGKTARYQLVGELLAWQELGGGYCKDSLGRTSINTDYVAEIVKAAKNDPLKFSILSGSYQRAKTDPFYVFSDQFACQILQASAANFDLVELVPPTEAEMQELRFIGALDNTDCDLPRKSLWKVLLSHRYHYLSNSRLGGLEAYSNVGDARLDLSCAQLEEFGVSAETPQD